MKLYHWSEDRPLTNRERARLQTFPDWFTFSGSRSSVQKQIGMAVPPEGARIIFQALANTLNQNKYKGVRANVAVYPTNSIGIFANSD